ncbi:hypothetical protein BN1723_008605 [Verticillium longisporum]|uniref:Uncharacterized protein n=1 Tax=Verticillium longisporum TaxID=100787 RepID=A0A0G4KI19_VERLO|nr:hypothetical protein BN1723_008605 [Verticillium longisporum]
MVPLHRESLPVVRGHTSIGEPRPTSLFGGGNGGLLSFR